MKNDKLLAKHLLWPLIILTIALTGVAFFISFQALVDLATISGIPHPFLYPVIIDGFVVIAALWLLVFGKLYPKAKNYSWASLILFSAVSILGNALHAANHAETGIIQLWLATILSSFPAIALLIASHLLLIGMQVRYAHAVIPPRQSKPAKVETTLHFSFGQFVDNIFCVTK